MLPTIDEIKARLAAQKTAKEKAAHLANAKDQESNLKASQAVEAWAAASNMMQHVVHAIDTELAGSGLNIEHSPATNRLNELANFSVNLQGSASAQLIVPIDLFGDGRTEFYIGGMRGPGPSFSVLSLTAERWRTILLDFIDKAVPA